jgi:hypothetical protein
VMIYNGQEVGEPARGMQGFGGDPRTSIFDYCGIPEHQKWMNNGKFDGGQLSADQKNLHGFYSRLLNAVTTHEALSNGEFYELMMCNQQQPGFDQGVYFYARYTEKQRVLVVANFNRYAKDMVVKIADDLLKKLNISGPATFTDLLYGNKYQTDNIYSGVRVSVYPTSGLLLEF